MSRETHGPEQRILDIRAALEPVMHWYDGAPADGEEREPRDLVEILTDVVADLQADRAISSAALSALRVADTALTEVGLAQHRGASWYTNRASGLYQQVDMWVRKGRAAIKAALDGEGVAHG